MNNFKEGWYLIYTKPRHERKVHAWLTELDINCFLPVVKKLRVYHDRKKYVDEPLFPSYVFIYLTDMANYYNGIDAEGALYYVKTGKEIARVSESVVNNIKLAVNQTESLEVSHANFEIGKRLVINKGPLTGLSCEVVESDNTKKLLVRVDLLRRNLVLNLPEECLMAV